MAMDKDKQMEMLFEEGGIADDGMSVDPVSGNQVPAGSMASEVRDDVPAQLSEGEYVVPADVTRYYGVKFFEDLRTQAKMGLGEMEQEGRIGGEPVAVEEGVLTPEEEEVLNMAMGGFVGKQGYNEGGSVASNVAPQFTMANYLFGGAGLGSFGTGTGSAGSEGGTAEDRAVILYGPNGSTVSLVLPAQQAEYEAYLEQGYSETQNVTTQQSVNLAGGDGGDNIRDFQGGSTRGGTGSVSSEPNVPISEMNANQVVSALGNMPFDPNSKATGVISKGLSAVLPGPLSLVPKVVVGASKYRANKLEERAKELGIDLDSITDPNVDLSRENFTSDSAFNRTMEDFAPAGMTYNPVNDEGEGGNYTSTTPTTAPATSAIPVQRPDRGGSDGGNNGSTSSDTSNVGNWGGDRDNDGVPNAVDFDDGVGWADTNKDDTGGSSGGGDSCFLAGTLVTLANGIQKPIEEIQLNDKLEGGGNVFALGQFLNDEIFDYEGVLVSGSHLVKEGGKWLRVRDSDLATPHSDEEHKVYVLGTENHVIEIQGITFSDYFEAHTQELLLKHQDMFMDFYKSGAYNEESKKLREEAVNNGDVQ